MQQFENRVAVVTGAASGIGRALALALADEACDLALSDVNEEGLQETAEVAGKSGVRVTATRLDVADRDAVHHYAGQTAAAHGKVNLVFNNAGVALDASVEEVSYEDFDWLMAINFWGVVHGTKAFLPHLKQSGEGHVINISSVFGLIAVPRQSAYNAAKFAVRGFTECLREELELEGSSVSATCVHPGGIKTNIVRDGRLRGAGAEGRDQLVADFERLARTTPEKAAQTILRGVRRNARRVLIGPDAYVIDRIQRWLPTAYQRLVASASRRQRTGRS